MWINNYDDPEELALQGALDLLNLHHYRIHSNSDTGTNIIKHPYDGRVFFCLNDDDIIQLAIGEALSYG